MQDAIDGQHIPGDRGVRVLAAAILALSEAMRCRLEAVDRNQQLLLEAVSALQWRVELLPQTAPAGDAPALEAEMGDALRWTRSESDPAPFVIHVTR